MSLDLSPGIYHGALVEVVEAEGTGLVGDHALGATTLTVAAGGAFRTAGDLSVAGSTYAYTRVGDVLSITPGLAAAAADGDPVTALAADGTPDTLKKAIVDLDMTGEVDQEDLPRAWIPGEVSGYYPLGTAAAGSFVDVTDTTYGYRLVGRPTDAPQLDGSYIDATTAPVGQAFSPDAPSSIDGFPEGYGWWQVDADNNVLGFWRLSGGAWVSQTVVTIEALKADNALFVAATGGTFTGATFQTRSAAERGIKLIAAVDEAGLPIDGLYVYDEVGVPFLTAVPREGMAMVAGLLKTNSFTVTPAQPDDKTSIAGLMELVRNPDGTAGVFRLTAYTTRPGSAPVVTTTYDQVQFTDDGKWGDRAGWATDGTYWYTARMSGSDLKVEKWSSAGVLQTTGTVTGAGAGFAAAGCVVNAGKVYVLLHWVSGTAEANLWRFSAATLAWETRGDWTLENTHTPALGVDTGTGDLLIAQSRASDGKVKIGRYTMGASYSDDLVPGASIVTANAYAHDLSGVYYGAGDLGANRYIFTGTANQQFKVVDSTGAAVSAEDWQAGMSPGKVGFTYVNRTATVTTTNGSTTVTGAVDVLGPTSVGSAISGTGIPAGAFVATYVNSTTVTISAAATASGTVTATLSGFKSMDTAGLMRTYTGQDKATAIDGANLTKWVSNTLANATLETDQSPRAKITIPKRTKLNVTTSAINTGGTNAPDRVKVYVGQGSTDPGRAAMWKQTDPATGVTTATYSSLATSGTNPPATNGFIAAGGTVQQLQLADGTVVFDGLGNGAAWTTYTPAWTAATTNPTLGNGTIAGRYQKRGQTVVFSIVLTAGSTTNAGSGAYSFGLPVAARAVNEVGVHGSQSGPNHMYIGRNDTNTTTFNMHLTSTDGVMNGVTSGLISGTVVRITGTYEAA